MTVVKLGDHIDTQKGFAFKSSWFKETGVNVVKVSDFTADSVSLEKAVKVEKEIALKYMKYEISAGDVVIQTVGSWPSNPASVVGKAVRIPLSASGSLLNQNAVKLLPKISLDQAYLFYLLKDDAFKNYIVGTAQGAASQASITLDSIRNFSFFLPDLQYQKRVAETLEKYDLLIENNTRRIAILEEMTQAIYREWFVEFKYPGAHSVTTRSGDLPEGWHRCSLGSIAKVNPEGITARTAPAYINYVDISSVSTGQIDAIQPTAFADAPSRARRVVRDKDIIWATVRPNRRQFAFVSSPIENTIVSTGFAVIRAHEVPASFLYFACTTEAYSAYLVNRATGSAYPAVNAGDFEESEIVLPPKDLLDKFDSVVLDKLLLAENLRGQNRVLREQRDLLLPKLISGQIELS